MFLSVGGTSLTTLPAISTSPDVAASSPAAMRSTVVLPEPDGPTSTRNSPSAIRSSRPSTATAPLSNTFRNARNSTSATSGSIPRGDQVAVPQRTPLWDPPLRRIVDVDDSEPLVVAALPFEVVEQRPDVVAAHVDTLRARAIDRSDVLAQVADAPLVVDGVSIDEVVERRSVLGDDERQVAVVALDPNEQLGQRLRDDRPTHGRLLAVLRDLAQTEDGVVVGRDEIRPVEVHAEEVEGLR